jgi:FMN phosphatase YigB (HAD superfamily)
VKIKSDKNQAIEYRDALVRCHYAETRRLHAQQVSSNFRSQSIARFTLRKVRQLTMVSAWCVDSIRPCVRTVGRLAAVSFYCRDARIVSFDVFDTLLYRTVEPPDILKRRAANYAAQLLSRQGFPITSELFLFIRNESEVRLRAEALRRGFDPECKLSAILRETLHSLCGPEVAAEETKNLVRYEIEVERQHLRVVPGAKELLADLKASGKKIILTTDTYLENQHIEDIFADVGLDRYVDTIYVSAEYRAGKSSGRLFQKLLGVEGMEPRSIVHIGDAYDRDVRGAVKVGIRAIFVLDISQIRRRRHLARVADQTLGGRQKLSNTATPLRSNAEPRTMLRGAEREVFIIGRDILGPAFCIFVLRVIEESYRLGASDIYYLAREGCLFSHVHRILIQNIHRLSRLPAIPCHYLYVSRQATTISSIWELGERERKLAAYRLRSANLGECLRAFGLDPEQVEEFRIDLQSENPEAVQRLFSNKRFVALVKAKAAIERPRLRRYLEQQGFFASSEPKVLVDIGWNATIQTNLTRAFHDDPDFPMLIGLYFGRRYEHVDDYSFSSRSIFAPGFFFDEANKRSAERAIGHCLELFELAAGAPHGATVGYKESRGVVEPVLSSSYTALSAEQEWLQAGIMDHVTSFSKDYNDHEPDVLGLRDAVSLRLAKFIRKPTLPQTQALRELVHSIDWGSERGRPLIAADLTPLSVFTPRRLMCSLKNSYWAEGSLRLSRIPGGLVLLAFARRIVRVEFIVRRLARFGFTLYRHRI